MHRLAFSNQEPPTWTVRLRSSCRIGSHILRPGSLATGGPPGNPPEIPPDVDLIVRFIGVPWSEAIPPSANCFVADIDAELV